MIGMGFLDKIKADLGDSIDIMRKGYQWSYATYISGYPNLTEKNLSVVLVLKENQLIVYRASSLKEEVFTLPYEKIIKFAMIKNDFTIVVCGKDKNGALYQIPIEFKKLSKPNEISSGLIKERIESIKSMFGGLMWETAIYEQNPVVIVLKENELEFYDWLTIKELKEIFNLPYEMMESISQKNNELSIKINASDAKEKLVTIPLEFEDSHSCIRIFKKLMEITARDRRITI